MDIWLYGMKTTVEISDALFIEAKKTAAAWRMPLRRLMEEGLRWRLRRGKADKTERRKIRWVTEKGGLPADLNLRSREEMHTWITRHS